MAFPEGFLWGAATAAHQVEGNNVASDFWALEHTPGSFFAEPSGDACDHYRLFRQDIALLAELGFNSYRFSIEWARVEPEDGRFSRAAIEHYRDVLQACHDHGLTPVVTLHHFTSPRWLTELGGWEYDKTPERFAAYCGKVMSELGPLVPYACTINEANIGPLIRDVLTAAPQDGREPAGAPVGVTDQAARDGEDALSPVDALPADQDRPKVFLFTFSEQGVSIVKRAHTAARQAIRDASPATQVGLTLALQDIQPEPGGEKQAERIWAETFEDFVPALDGDDFLGVQSYTRSLVGSDGPLPVPDGAETTQMGYEFYPQAMENVLRRATTAGLPLIVTEHGIGTADDSRRVEFVRQGLAGLERAVTDGVDVRGYLHWSAFDNYEWMLGYRPTFGLIAVDRDTQRRTPKESARYLGALAQRNALA
ncbi:glycoside hydrolase family 1 protein [Streptomyces lomondensis]|uniref:Beta-glucosidase n=1 Tax=Streptomyces lomondensis TaxID=68229 RepID=A0ABQ2XRQ4_9ACTN|nr:family 1 glycosylhydrolase [Streptomyces lomondensis]MCF0080877.1 family 1 glycosylhydrolase [Streptomyces lomondensis]GGX30970.1 beta-glucosidase [Streptomyces lomondensis]